MIKRVARFFAPAAALFVFLLMVSCIGIETGINIRSNGSGTIDLEYRLSHAAESLGKLDGNEGWPIVPVGKTDFQRSVQRIEGLRLKSFSSRDDGKNMINKVRLEFSRPEALVRFLDPLGEGASYTEQDGKKRLTLNLGGAPENADPQLLELFKTVTEGYEIILKFSLPKDGQALLRDRQGNSRTVPAGVEISGPGKKPSFKAPLSVILSDTQGFSLEIVW
ncbi:hypothetical protein AGMMS49928_01160 [Spirochaetia bacterium]|nr:hypothetical protein AGMMS49928_01160 [Spirochaetia bacterium]